MDTSHINFDPKIGKLEKLKVTFIFISFDDTVGISSFIYFFSRII